MKAPEKVLLFLKKFSKNLKKSIENQCTLIYNIDKINEGRSEAMTKAQSAEIKAIIGKGYKTYYSSQKEQLSVRVYSYINNNLNAEAMERSIKNLLNKVEGMHLQYEIIQRTYQGFIHDTCVIFK